MSSNMHVAVTDIWTGKDPIRAGTVIKEHHGLAADLEKMIEKGAVKVVSRKAVTEEAVITAEDQSTKPWNWSFDKADLEGKTLDQLNMMALDHCEKHGREPIDPFEDVEEAIAYMTMDVEEKG